MPNPDDQAHDHDGHHDDQLPDGEQQSQGDAASREIEASARAQGWRPKDQFTGEPDKWVDASTFVDRGNSFKSNLVQKVASLERQLADFKGTAAQFTKFHQETMAKKDKELADTIRQLKIQKSEATADGDHGTAVELEDRIDTLNQERQEANRLEKEALERAAAAAAEPQVDPVLADWVADGNEWFDADPKLRRYAMSVAEELRAKGSKLSGREFLDRMLLEVKTDFPEKFTNPNRRRAGAVDNGAGGRSSGGRTAADLPAEDRTLMNKFVKEGMLTEKEFLAEYKWSN